MDAARRPRPTGGAETLTALGPSLLSPLFQRALLESTLVGALAGCVGVHVLLRRMSFFVVAMSHATFPGVVLASLFGISLFVGGMAAGVLVVLAVLIVGRSRALDHSSAVGVVLAGSFALGVLILSARPGESRDLSAFLVGQVLAVSRADVAITVVVGAVLLGVLAATHKEMVAGAFDPVGLGALGIRTVVLDLVAMLVVTVALVVSIPAVGTLLAVALLTVPALAARQCTERVAPMMTLAALIGAASGALGLCFSAAFDVAAGGAIALCAVGAFGVCLAARRVMPARFAPA